MTHSFPRLPLVVSCLALLAGVATADNTPIRREWQVADVKREALVAAPESAKTTPSPVVFAFHGHGGTMQQAARTFAYHRHWPEAIVVYMQGLNTPGRLTDLEGKRPGWQHGPGEQQDRDLNFFDAVFASLKQDYSVDEQRVYATGHSNGGSFTYLLWGARGDVFAAVAPSASIPNRDVRPLLKPKPVLHVAGENDELVKYTWQSVAITQLRRLNQCSSAGTAWEPHCTLYASTSGFPVVTFITDGRHKFPDEAPVTIVKFFQEHSRSPSPAQPPTE
jgi:polyhydroxybutyrate depolymerase